ncbi:serine hydrolase domain-containing protein [Glycomyces harbinensis]|uniref:CubicO group peptidase, beta-lactamase class C family n=1 Tax=Glycomyces harbinensis TaxID=58114 RepID=A0A1G7A1X9_9ACTN|nr:serine hydrolase domain-containing protein [Glycomyces harbinensis]SDE08643.1 CubicO group peptidase, beta-lactamase class C family [Glycomyces harbinensis]
MRRSEHRSTRRTLLGAAGAVPVAAGIALTADAAHADPGRVPKSLKPGGELDRHVRQLAENGQFSGTFGVYHRGRRTLRRSYGLANVEAGVANEDDTIYALASVTKALTGLAIGQLVERGDVAYHQTVGHYLDGFAAEVADRVTVHHLLTHTSGLGDYMRLDGYLDEAAEWASEAECWDGLMRYIREDTLQAAPGTGDVYSNTGFSILGAIIAAASGQTYYDYVREHVFAPAGMADSDFCTRPEWTENPRIAHPYAPIGEEGERIDVVADHVYLGGPAGGAFSTVDDMHRLTAAPAAHDLIGAEHLRLLTGASSPKPPLGGTDTAFGTYFGPGAITNGTWVHQISGGSNMGLSADLQWFPDDEWTVVALSHWEQRTSGPVVAESREIIAAL